MIYVQIQKLHKYVQLPKQAHPGDAGLDLSFFPEPDTKGNPILESISIAPGARCKVPCGFKMAIPMGYEAQVRPRSGLAINKGIVIPNSPGTIDSGYRGEVCVILMNLGSSPFIINVGDRVAQMVINQLPQVSLEVVSDLSDTPRGENGFGSSGVLVVNPNRELKE